MNKISYENFFQYIKSYYPFLIFFVLFACLHIFMGLYGDDAYFSKVLSEWSLLDFIKYRYTYWTSRVIQDSAMVLLSRQNIILWKILDSIIYTIGIYYLVKIVNKENSKKIALLGVLLFFMYPFYEMGSAGWIATTLTYSWTFSLSIVAFIPLINDYYDEKTHKLTYIISFLALLYAVNHEQSCALIFGFSTLLLINAFINKKKINKYNYILILISILSLLFIFTCPGTSSRFAIQLASKYPQFASFGLLEKSYLGIVTTMGILFSDKLIFSIFYILLNVCVWFKTQNKYLKYILYLNIIFIIFLICYQTLFDISNLQNLKPFMAMFGNNTMVLAILGFSKSIVSTLPSLQGAMILFNSGVPNKIGSSVILVLFISLYFLISSCLLLFKGFDKKIFPLILFGAGFISRFIMGFSPEVLTSGARTAIYFYISLIMLTLMVIKKLYDENRLNKKAEHLIFIIFTIGAMIVYGYVLVLSILFF